MAVAMLAVALGGASPATASRAGCIKAVGSSKKANDRSESGQGIVLSRGGKLYSCQFNDPRKNDPLPGQDPHYRILRGTVVVKGRYAAYGSVQDAGDHTNTTVFSVHLRKGNTAAASDEVNYSQDVDLTNLQLRPNGSFVWMFSWPAGDPEHPGAFSVVYGFDRVTKDTATLFLNDTDNEDVEGSDPENPIVRGSLVLRHDHLGATGWGVTWARKGAATPRVDVH
jgi:hypothetical protein